MLTKDSSSRVSVESAIKVVLNDEAVMECAKRWSEHQREWDRLKPLLAERLHVSIFLPRSLRAHRRIKASGEMLALIRDIEPPPIQVGNNVFVAHRHMQGKDKTSLFCLLNYQEEWKVFQCRIRYALGIEPCVESNRIFHISIANTTGSVFDSVGDVCIDDML